MAVTRAKCLSALTCVASLFASITEPWNSFAGPQIFIAIFISVIWPEIIRALHQVEESFCIQELVMLLTCSDNHWHHSCHMFLDSSRMQTTYIPYGCTSNYKQETK